MVDTTCEAVQALIAEGEATADRLQFASENVIRRMGRTLAALLDERDGMVSMAWHDEVTAEAQRQIYVLEQRIRDLKAELGTSRRQFTTLARSIDGLRSRAERAEAERDVYKRAKAENDERFQIEAAEQRERADRLAAKLDAVKAFIANRSVIGGMDRMRLAAILADTDEGKDSITFNTDDLGPATDIDGNPLADTDEGSEQ